MAKTFGTIEVICPSNRGGWVKLTWLDAPWGEQQIFEKGKVFRPDIKSSTLNGERVWVAREIRIPTGEYMVKWQDKEEWVRVYVDDVTVIDFR